MNTKKALFVLLLIAALVCFAACTPADEQDPADQDNQGQVEGEGENEGENEGETTVSLNDWAGTWNSFHSYLADPALEDTYAQLAGEGDVEAKKAEIAELYKSDLMAVVIADNTLSIYSEAQGQTLNEEVKVADVTYSYQGEVEGTAHTWYQFNADTEDAAFPILLFSAVTEEVPNSSLNHFYFLYGEDVEAMLAVENWAPMMVSVGTDISLIAGHLAPQE